MAKMKGLSLSFLLFSVLSYGSQETGKRSTSPKRTTLKVTQRRTTKVPSHEELLHYPRKNFYQKQTAQSSQTTQK